MCRIKRETRDGNQGRAVTENAEDVVAGEVNALDVTAHRLITEAHAETQSAIGRRQPQQMIGNAPTLERDKLLYDDRPGTAFAGCPTLCAGVAAGAGFSQALSVCLIRDGHST
ncbi:MAG TPA: hypothetical protein VFM11_01070 [Burkholderiales bacterium]|nr:hypothetical protein [Burkholderiales bacterium]